MDKINSKSSSSLENDIDVAEVGDGNQAKWGSDIVAQAINKIGIEYIAQVPGASFRGFQDSIVNHLGNRSPQIITCLHEEHAVSIADGYGRVTEKPMAVALHSNVGLMHATMPIFNAWCDRTPMLIIGATGPVDANKRRPWIDWIHTSKDQASIIRDYIKWDDQPMSPESCVEAILRANQICQTAPYGPVYVCLDVGMQETALNHEVKIPPIERFQPASHPAVPAGDLEKIIRLIGEAKSPLMLIGRVSRSQSDWDRRVELVESLGCAVMTTLHDRSSFPTEHPLHICAPIADKPTEDDVKLVQNSDLIISLGWHDLAGFLLTRLGETQTQSPINVPIVHCSQESYLANGWSMDYQALPAVDVPVLASPDRLIGALIECLSVTQTKTISSQAMGQISHWIEKASRPETDETEGNLDIKILASTLGDFAQSHKVTFARLPIGWPGSECRFRGPLDYLGKDGGGAVGTGPGHTIGTALALKDNEKCVIGVIGDGDFLMGSNALWTASHLQIPMMIVVANNSSFFNDEVHQERVAVTRDRPVENKWIGQRLDNPAIDICAIAKAQGFEVSGKLDTAGDVAKALLHGHEIVKNGGRYLIDATITPGYS